MARPQQKSGNVIVAKDQSDGEVEDQDAAQRSIAFRSDSARGGTRSTGSTIPKTHVTMPGQGCGYNMPFMSLDGAVRPGHESFNEYGWLLPASAFLPVLL